MDSEKENSGLKIRSAKPSLFIKRDVEEVKKAKIESPKGFVKDCPGMENVCGPGTCDFQQIKPFELDTDLIETESLGALEQYNYTCFPEPIKYKYIEILKIYDFPFDKIGPFVPCEDRYNQPWEEKTRKPIKLAAGYTSKIFSDAMEEAQELFYKVGYEGEIIDWLMPLVNVNPKPDNPFDYLSKARYFMEKFKDDPDFTRNMEVLKSSLTLENELTFELAQIKLLIGMINEKEFDIDGTPKSSCYEDRKHRILRDLLIETLCDIKSYKREILKFKKEERSRYKKKIIFDPEKRKQALHDLEVWKNYVPPVMENFVRDYTKERDDGRVKDWFEGLTVPDPEGRKMSIIIEEVKEPSRPDPLHPLIDVETLSSGILLEEY